ncbi:MAG: 16S rRNA (cytosine(967)-C(5))-methyltransferase RsmB [Coriobacteriia bacterium]|nr:16S rRNA (cytosine(967)-C(5))-methyltransferase RsmB [Coriobacteriia bacterium]MBN2822729.1 16S rRNA (cytosine(967)-C(5))-methyltransferase RsmB [Coriobacteriia bacterium]
MRVSPSRHAAIGILSDIRRRGAFSRPVVDAAVNASSLSREDAAFASRLVYGVITAEGMLDNIINEFAKRPGAVEPRVRDSLRMSIYEILFLRTPARAAVHQGVDAVRTVRPAASGFANAVLRRVAERADTFPWGDPSKDRDALARASASPRWLVDRFIDDLGLDAATAALMSGLEAPPMFVRVNPYRATVEEAFDLLADDGAMPQSSPPDQACIRCDGAREAVHGQALERGLVVVTDAAAQVAPLACAPKPGSKILDVGAGRGTKTAVLQGIALGQGGPAEVTAVDIHGFKLDTLAVTMSSLGIPSARTEVLDATDAAVLEALGDGFDIVLVDAPCSGLGTLRRHPEKRWRLVPEDIERLVSLQSSLLDAASRAVRPGGVVVYSTCTVTRAENQGVVSAFLAGDRGDGFEVKPLHDAVPEDWQRFITTEGMFCSWPESGGADGHFVAALARTRA